MTDGLEIRLVATGEVVTLSDPEPWPSAPEGWYNPWVAKNNDGQFTAYGDCIINGRLRTNCIAAWRDDHWEMVSAGGQEVVTV